MRIVVFSDSHNNFFVLKEIMRVQLNADAFIHLGDGKKEFDYLCANHPFKMMRSVAGNCDWSVNSNDRDTMTVCGKTIFFTHGHNFGVKSGLERLKQYAHEIGADIALYGHTHEADAFYEDGVYYMNPGSVSLPRGGPASYGIIDITEAGIVTAIVPL